MCDFYAFSWMTEKYILVFIFLFLIPIFKIPDQFYYPGLLGLCFWGFYQNMFLTLHCIYLSLTFVDFVRGRNLDFISYGHKDVEDVWTLLQAVKQNGDTLNQLKALNAEQEKDVERVRQREELLAKVSHWVSVAIVFSLTVFLMPFLIYRLNL